MCPAVSIAGSGADPAARGGGGRGGSLPHREVLPDEPTGGETNRSAASKRYVPSNECSVSHCGVSGVWLSGFALGSTIESKTKGIWMWCVPHPTKAETTLVLLDTEGLGDVDKVK